MSIKMTQFDCPLQKGMGCHYYRCCTKNQCMFLKRFGTYFTKANGAKVQRFYCGKTSETFTQNISDINIHYFHRKNDTKIADLYHDRLRCYTLMELGHKYNLTISEVRTRLKRAKKYIEKNEPPRRRWQYL